MKYMIEAVHILETDEDVFRYAWFIPRTDFESPCHNNLLESPGKGLTPLGKVYVNMSSFDKTLWYKPGDVIPAEHYTGCRGTLSLAPATDVTGILQVSGLGKDNAVEYQIEVPASGDYKLEVRYNSDSQGLLRFRLDGKDLGTSILPNSYVSWKTHKTVLTLPEGRHVLEVSFQEDSRANINWLRFE